MSKFSCSEEICSWPGWLVLCQTSPSEISAGCMFQAWQSLNCPWSSKEKTEVFYHLVVPCTSEGGKPPASTRKGTNITIDVVHFQSTLSRKKVLLHLSSHFKITSLSLTRESTVLRLRPNMMDWHLRTHAVLYFEVSVGILGWHFITPQSSFYWGRITLIDCKTTLLPYTLGSKL